ncbi:MAG: general stress protein [Solibacillus sp.]
MERNEERIVDVVYSTQDMLAKIQEYRAPGGLNDHIYVFSNEVSEFHALSRDADISIYKPGGIRNMVKSFFTKENPIEEGLRKLDLTAAERQRYMDILNNGGIILVTGFDPFSESPLSNGFHERHGPYHRHFENKERGPLATMILGDYEEPIRASYMEPTQHTGVASDFGKPPRDQ